MTELEIIEKLYYITERYDEPPTDRKHWKHDRAPWNKFGCMDEFGRWNWFSTRKIFKTVTEADVRDAMKELGE